MFHALDEEIHLYASLLSLLACALMTLICVLFSAAVIMGLSFPSFYYVVVLSEAVLLTQRKSIA